MLKIAWRNGGKRRSDCKQYADSHVLVVSYRQISTKLRIKKLIAMFASYGCGTLVSVTFAYGDINCNKIIRSNMDTGYYQQTYFIDSLTSI